MRRDTRRLRLILALLLLTSFTLITLDYRSGKSGAFGSLRHVTSSVFGPLEDGLSSGTRPIGHFFDDVFHAGRDGSRVRSLQTEVDALQGQLRAQGDITRERAELTQLVTLAGTDHDKIVAAQVIAEGDASGFDYAVTLNVGSHDGVAVDMTVISGGQSGGGLVGRVVSVQAYTSVVAVIYDPNVHVGSRLQDNAQLGLTSGHGLDPLTFTPADPAVRPKPGEVVETFGTSEYAAGIPIGVVSTVAPTPGFTTLTASVKPFINYTSLDVVGVVLVPSRTTPAPQVLPTVTATVTRTVTLTPTPTLTTTAARSAGADATVGSHSVSPTARVTPTATGGP